MVIEIISGICCFVFLAFDHYFLNNPVSECTFDIALLFKMLASTCFVISGLFAFRKARNTTPEFKKVASLIFCGLILGFTADLFLEINFYAGFLVFVAAHIFYYLAFSVYSRMNLKKWIFILLFVATFAVLDFFAPWFDFKGLFPFIVIYSAVWAFVFVKSIDSLKWKSAYSKTMVLGIVAFGISDILLQFKFFPEENFSAVTASLIFLISNSFYYLGQLLIAHSIGKDYIEK